MENLLAHCGTVLANQHPLIISAMIGGMVGSLSHCSVMCSPLVAAQMLSLQERRRPAALIWFYHAGRIATYVALGLISVLAGKWLFSGALNGFSHVMLVLAGALFLVSAVVPAKTHACCSTRTRRLRHWLEQLRWPALQHYLRGMLMGFMPCGLLLSVLLTVSTLPSGAYAALVMAVFGASTIPVLQVAGRAALSLGNRYPHLGVGLGRAMMAGNGMFLCGIGLNLLPAH